MIGLWCSSALMFLLFFDLSLQCLLVQVEFIQFRFDLSRSCLEVDTVNSDSVVTGGTGGTGGKAFEGIVVILESSKFSLPTEEFSDLSGETWQRGTKGEFCL